MTTASKKYNSLSKMERSNLSFYYHLACDRAHTMLDELYESLHDSDGSPIIDQEIVDASIEAVSDVIREELNIIKSALDEHIESKGKEA